MLYNLRQSKIWLGGALLALVALVMVTPSAFGQSYGADVAVNNQTTTNQCSSGEPVLLNGNVPLQYSVSTDSNGVNHFSIKASNSLSGTGQKSGASYSASDSDDYGLSSSQASAELIVELKSTLSAQGPSANMTLVQTIHITVDTAGNLSAQVQDNTTQCGA